MYIFQNSLPKLVPEQRLDCDIILQTKAHLICFKYFIIYLKNVNVETLSRFAATLLDGGQIAHSALKLLLIFQITEAPTCNINKNYVMNNAPKSYQLIILD
ncbi:unnamed protein product [Lymnaea stagnalis]|uniref:DNA helicase n=1 Tax=Lymnaea stagnalis TaxID=6523 RepID=A0AAV2IAL6_LYMST